MVNMKMMMRLMNSVLMMTPIAMVATIAINLVSSVSGQPAFIISNSARPDHSIVTTLPARPWYGHNPARPNNSMDTTKSIVATNLQYLPGQTLVLSQTKVWFSARAEYFFMTILIIPIAYQHVMVYSNKQMM